MKILMVTMSMNIGGAETHILELCRELHNNGNDITLASFGGVYADELIKCGIKHVTLPLHSKNPASVIESYKGLRSLIYKEKYDIVHAHARIPAFICGLIHDSMHYEDGTKFRFVTTAHLNFSTNALLRKISRWGERVMAVSDDITDYLVDEYSYPRDKIDVTINGIDTKKFSSDTDFTPILEKHSLDADKRRIVYMSRLDEDRADPAFKLIEIAPALAEKYPDTDIIIVGGGNVFDRIKNDSDKANEKIGRKYITVTGAVSNTNEYCSSATVFIGVSRSALEAMSAEKPVIVAGNQGSLGIFDESKIKAAIDTNFCCRGFECADTKSLFGDLSTLLDMSPDELKKIGTFNRGFILENYTARRMAKDYTDMYNRVLSSPAPISVRHSRPDIVMSGYYGFGNLGDESLLDIITQSLGEEIKGVKIAVLTKSPKKDSMRTGLGSVQRYNVFEIGSLLGRSKLLVSGGGSLLQDSTSNRSLGYYAGVMKIAKAKGAKVAVFSNGIGPISYEANRLKTKTVIDAADYISVRDEGSKTELDALGISDSGRVVVSADPAFLIESAEPHKLDRVISKCGLEGKKFFAVSLRPMKSQKKKNAPISSEDAEIVNEVAEVCRSVYEKYKLVPLIIPMQNAQDSGVCTMLYDCLKVHGVEAVILKPESARELIGVLGKAEFLIGMRLHSIIFASSAGCPVIGLSYDPKVSSMMKELGQKYIIDLGAEDNFAGDLESYTESAIAGRKEIGEFLSARAAEMRNRCREDIKQIHNML